MKNRNVLLVVAGIIMIGLGVSNFLKGVDILNTAGMSPEAPGWTSPFIIYFTGVSTIIIAVALSLCGIFLLMERLSWILYLGLFLILSIYVNAYIYGEALGSRVVIDFTFGLLVVCLMWLGARRLK